MKLAILLACLTGLTLSACISRGVPRPVAKSPQQVMEQWQRQRDIEARCSAQAGTADQKKTKGGKQSVWSRCMENSR